MKGLSGEAVEGIVTSRRTEDTIKLGRLIAGDLRGGDMILLRGSIGAGKSVLARGIAEALGSQWRGSPTFTLIHEYSTLPPLVHADLYRLEAADVEELGLEEYATPAGILVIEWAERAGAYLSQIAARSPLWIDLAQAGGDERLIRIWKPRRAEPPFAFGAAP